MKNIYKWIAVVAIAAIVIVVVTNNSKEDTAIQSINSEGNSAIEIGAVLPLSGDFAEVGEFIKQGMELAISDYQEKGVNVNLHIQDDNSNARGSVNAANALLAQHDLDVALTATVQEVKPIAPIFNEKQIPLIAVWDNNDVIANSGDYIFSTGYLTENAGQDMAKFARSKDVSRVAVITQQDEWSNIIGNAFRDEFINQGGEVALTDDVNFDVTDFRTFLTKAKNENVEGIYFPFIPGYIGPFVRQASELGLDVMLMTGDSMAQGEIDDAGDVINGTYFTSVDKENLSELIARYNEFYGVEPSGPAYVSFGYHGVQMAIEAGLKTDLSMREALEITTINGFDGDISFDENNQSERTQDIFQVQNLEIVKL